MSLRTIISGLLASLLLFFGVAGTSFAQETTSTEDNSAEVQALLEQIQALLAVIEALQAQLSAANANGGTVSTEFTRNLSIGDDNFEVKALQQMLNNDPRTRVAVSGPGSPGQESTFYGNLTADAVSKFQELYRSEILTPAGLTRGSGFFGPGTRAKMNALINAQIQSPDSNIPDTSNSNSSTQSDNTSSNTTQTSNTSSNANNLSGSGLANTTNSVESGGANALTLSGSSAYETYDGFAVGSASSYAGKPGESITIQGLELTSGTKIHFGDEATVTGTAFGGTALTFIVPNIKKGPYELTFTSESGEEAIRIMDFVITQQNATAPEIFSVSPSLGPDGALITIHGSGFTATGNQIEFGQNVVSNISSSDGKTLKVNVASGLEISSSAEFSETGVAEWPVFIYVANANGRIEEPGLFVIRN